MLLDTIRLHCSTCPATTHMTKEASASTIALDNSSSAGQLNFLTASYIASPTEKDQPHVGTGLSGLMPAYPCLYGSNSSLRCMTESITLQIRTPQLTTIQASRLFGLTDRISKLQLQFYFLVHFGLIRLPIFGRIFALCSYFLPRSHVLISTRFQLHCLVHSASSQDITDAPIADVHRYS